MNEIANEVLVLGCCYQIPAFIIIIGPHYPVCMDVT